jgi:hypothetical protein
VRHVAAALLLLPSMVAIARAAEPAGAFSESAAVLLNFSERDLNRILVDSFHANGGPRFEGEKGRVSSSVADLRYSALFSDPVIRLGTDGTARLSLDIQDASLRIGRLERKIGGMQVQCEEAGLDVDPGHPLAVELALDLTVDNGALRLVPTGVEISDVEDRLRLVKPTRCSHTILPRWFLWWVGKPFLRRSLDKLDGAILARARKSAARLEEKQGLLGKRWEPASGLQLFPETVDTSGGSLLVGLTASNVGPTAGRVRPRPLDDHAPRPPGSFLGVSESFVNEVARRLLSGKMGSRRASTGDFRKLLKNDAVYALVPGLSKIDSKDGVDLEIRFSSVPRFEFDEASTATDRRALIRVLLSGVELILRKESGGRSSVLGTLRVDSARMSVVPFANILGGISFRLVENQWKVSSIGLEFDEDLVAATLQEVTFGKIFQTSYDPVLTRTLHLGTTGFVPQAFAVNNGYLLIGLGEPPRPEERAASAAATRTDTLLGSH